jgi:tyrosine-specific transport protein
MGAAFIIAGTCIGAGMLALPVSTAPAGFFVSVVALVIAWFFMYVSGLYVLEVNLTLAQGNNYVSMARLTLGDRVATLTGVGFALLLYSLLAAYVTSGGELTAQLLQQGFGRSVPRELGPILWTLGFAGLRYYGLKPMDNLNRVFMLGLVITYAIVVLCGIPHVEVKRFQTGEVMAFLTVFPIIFTSFGYQIVVPSISAYLDFSAPKVRQAILLGSVLPLIVYMCWETIIFGTIPSQGQHNSLAAILHSGHTTKMLIDVLQASYHSSLIGSAIHSFIFFAISSSFLGVSLGLFDFLADSLGLKDQSSQLYLLLLTFVPPLLYAEFFPYGFLFALNYAGILVALLHGVLPVLMVWVCRRQAQQGRRGVVLMGASLVFFIGLVLLDVAAMLGVW